ncbi:unnamed protein product [Clonostachys rhizophaga]|uniref:Uncharacterized protein n=1 Tax=Clonostachys rhizophaga TaxID=160324 RepID=A0A9N9VIZ9_9HYPO|nr:unnamed protein product [Clonostachys rhizophaga]
MSLYSSSQSSEATDLKTFGNFGNPGTPDEMRSAYRVPPIKGYSHLFKLLEGNEEIENTPVRTEVFSGTIRQHNFITKGEVLRKHGSTIGKVGRVSICRDQKSLLSAVLDIKKDEYQVLDCETRDRLGMFLQVYCPERADWVITDNEETTIDIFTDRTLELTRPISEELTLLPNRLQRLSDFFFEPNISKAEYLLVSRVLQVQAHRAAELVDTVCKLLQPNTPGAQSLGSTSEHAREPPQGAWEKTDQTASLIEHQLEEMRHHQEVYRELLDDSARSAEKVTERLSTVVDRVESFIREADMDQVQHIRQLENISMLVTHRLDKDLQQQTPQSTPTKKRLRSESPGISDEDPSDYTDGSASERSHKRANH